MGCFLQNAGRCVPRGTWRVSSAEPSGVGLGPHAGVFAACQRYGSTWNIITEIGGPKRRFTAGSLPGYTLFKWVRTVPRRGEAAPTAALRQPASVLPTNEQVPRGTSQRKATDRSEANLDQSEGLRSLQACVNRSVKGRSPGTARLPELAAGHPPLGRVPRGTSYGTGTERLWHYSQIRSRRPSPCIRSRTSTHL